MNTSTQRLRALLVALALLTAAAAAERVVGLAAPMPTAEAPKALRLAGYSVSPLDGEVAPRQGRELSHGALRRFRLRPLAGGAPFTLLLLPVRSRTGSEISASSKERKGLNMVAVAAEVPPFALKERRILSLPGDHPSAPAPKLDQVALGRGPGDPAGRVTRLQTCLTHSGHAGVSATTLVRAAQRRDPAATAPDLRHRWKRLAGLLQADHACLAVQVEGGQADQQTLLAVWKDLRSSLRTP